MSQHDYIVDNAISATVRADINSALAAGVSLNSGATEPTTTYAYMWWADTTTGLLKRRNSTNASWVTIMSLDSLTFASPTITGTANVATIVATGTITDSKDVKGVWSPELYDVSNSNAEGQTYGASNGGTYTRIGDLCFVYGRLTMTGLGTLTTGQRAAVGNLPFTVKAGTYPSFAVGYAAGLAITAGQSVSIYANGGGTRIALNKWSATTGTTEMTVGQVSATGDIMFAGVFEI